MQPLIDAFAYLTTSSHWTGATGFAVRIAEHLGYTVLAVLAAALIAVPVGVAVGHTGKGANAVIAISGALRALPELGLLTWLAITLPRGISWPIIPSLIVLVLLAVAPLLAGIVAGFESVERDVVLSARAAGFSEKQILRDVELPLAAPVMLGGLRSCVVQVLATATVVAYIGLGGLGRYLIDGLAMQDYARMVAGAIVVTLLALVVDVLLAGVQRWATPNGLNVKENA
ncbi:MULTISPECIES: ABC transporter permease [unclassified Corynebacterium]|uniref:ABC transporter permease n=1 Tax=unclassified Corynebacterium TaxID=2624378 RepID=UPI002652B7F4|nr:MULTISPECIES: ABC transporter permease subunit [unclassified Corynebacterium]MDN8594917.1 ABC transporter permease subunit [Corynebacterium sp. P4_F2]WKK56445.1 ABC transporter permease subunit [Corynebacterium sp. P4-C1]WKK63878.1 ABC transporter permease subunit [Corynebacterium sp. P8-C1]